jgi:Proline-rich nuclear receptor coactivator motif
MSTQTTPLPTHRSHRHTRSAALPTPAAASQNPQNPHYLNLQSHGSNSQLDMVQSPQPTTPPRTPQKVEPNTSTQNGPQLPGSDSVSKSRSKGKNRLKNATASPATSRNDRSTPPLKSVQSGGIATSMRPISTPSATAYAGPTFHASPAPSTLPIPSYYSKSVPESPGINVLQSQKEEASSSGIDSPTPPRANIAAAQPHREESPLDIFFKADREEKARARSASSFHGTASESGPFPLPSDSPQNPLTGNQGRVRGTHFSGGSTSALFAMELDGTNGPGKPYGPAFSTPYNERINAARLSAPLSQSPLQKPQEQAKSTDRSEALKAYLFSTQNRSPVTRSNDFVEAVGSTVDRPTSDSTSRNATNAFGGQRGAVPASKPHPNSFPYLSDTSTSRHSPLGGSRSSGLRQEFTSTTPPSQSQERAAGLHPTPPSPSRLPRQDSQPISRNSSGNFDSTNSTSFASASQSGTPSGTRNTNFKEMEDSLRRILKLEPVADTGVQATGISRMPEATVSGSNYVGGRAPPMNGMHNGVMGS